MNYLEGRPMHRSVLCALLAITLAGLAPGCTPLSERVARRPLGESSPDEANKELRARSLFELKLRSSVDSSTLMVLHRYGNLIHECAERYNLDWRFILAVMKTESSFSPSALSCKGAFGFMQIMPMTGEELEQSLDLMDFRSPSNNILGGVYYLRQLYDMFDGILPPDRLRLVLASYNAGPGRVLDAQQMVAFLHGDPKEWNDVKMGMALMDSLTTSIQSDLWPEGKPHNGWFVNPEQTVAYVDKVMDVYARYERVLE